MEHLEQLSLESLQISQELLSLHKVNAAIVQKLSGMVDRLNGFVRDQAFKFSKTDTATQVTTGFAKKLEKYEYSKLASVRIASPEGLQVDFISLAKVLTKCQAITSMINENCLIPYAQFVAESLNRPELTESLTRTHSVKLHNLEQLRKDLGRCYNGTAQERPYNDCVKRNADWMELENLIQELNLVESRMNKELISRKVAELGVLTQKLVDQMKDPNSSHRPSTKMIDDLSKMIYGVAEQVTFLSVVSTSIMQLSTVVEVAKGQLLQAAKNK